MSFSTKKLKECCVIIAGQSPESKYYNTNGDGIPFFQGKADFGDLYPTIRVYCTQPTKIAEENDILLSVRAPVGPTNLAPCKVCIGRGLTAIRPSDDLLTGYVLMFLRYFEAQLASKGTGTTFKAITQDVVKNLEIPIPPLDEQRHIVSRIEELFSELDNSVSALLKTKEQLKVYRQAVLKEAFDSIEDRTDGALIKDACKNVKVGIVIKPTQYYVEKDGIKAFRNANVRRNHIDNSGWALISREGHEKNKKSIVHENDVVIARSGANLGMAAVIPVEFDGYNAIDIVIAEPDLTKVNPHYLAYFINSPYGIHIVNEYQHGGAQGHLNVKEFGLLPFILGPIVEQNRVVAEIESRLSVCDSIERTVDTALQQAEAMRQSILKKAFEGEL